MTTRRVQLVKLLLLLGMAGLVVAVVGLYLLRKVEEFEPGFDPPVTEAEQAEVRQLGQNVDHTITSEGKPLFRVQGRSDRQDRDGTLHVEDVKVTLYRQDGEHFEVQAQLARYHPERKLATLENEVLLVAPRGFSMEAERLELTNQGQIIRSDGPVVFHSDATPPFDGTAGQFRGLVERGQFILAKGVELASRPEVERPFTLSGRQAVYAREQRIVRAEGQAKITWGGSRITAQRIATHLHPDRDDIEFVQARWQVKMVAEGSEEDGYRRLALEGDRLAVQMDSATGKPETMELEETGRLRPKARVLLHSGERYDLDAELVRVDFVDGQPRTFAGAGGLEVRAGFATVEWPLRRLCAQRGTVTFDAAGELVAFDLADDVELHEPGRVLLADEAVGSATKIEATGRPTEILTERGSMQAPRIEVDEATTLAHASGGVRTTLPTEAAGPFDQTPLGAAREPIHVTSDEAFWRQSTVEFLFRGSVRAWSGENMIRSGQLRGNQEARTVTAADDVESIFFTVTEGERVRRRIEVTADKMVFDELAGTVTYYDEVVLREGGQRLSADQIEIGLDGNGRAETVVATGSVDLRTEAEGREVLADRAEYDLTRERAVFFGEPVTLADRLGRKTSGRMMTYDLRDDTVRIFSEIVDLPPPPPPVEDDS